MAAWKRKTDWYASFWFKFPDGRKEQIKKKSPVNTKRGAEEYERQLRESLLSGSYGKRQDIEMPGFSTYADRFLATYAKNNNKASFSDSRCVLNFIEFSRPVPQSSRS